MLRAGLTARGAPASASSWRPPWIVAHPSKSAGQTRRVLTDPIQIISVQSSCVAGESEDFGQQATRIGDTGGSAGGQQAPVPHVLFRPEEVHLVSSQRELAAPFRNWHVDVRNHTVRRDREQLTSAHREADRLATVRAERIDSNLAARK